MIGYSSNISQSTLRSRMSGSNSLVSNLNYRVPLVTTVSLVTSSSLLQGGKVHASGGVVVGGGGGASVKGPCTIWPTFQPDALCEG